jgi:hypothetical protein
MEKDIKKQDKRPKRNKTVVIIDKELIKKLPPLPDYLIKKFAASLKKTYGNK